MATLILTVDGQSLSITSDIDKIVENSLEYLNYEVIIKNKEEWKTIDGSESLTTKVIFTSDKYPDGVQGSGQDKGKVPPGAIEAPGFSVSVVGYQYDNITKTIVKQIPTNPLFVNVWLSGETSGSRYAQEDLDADWLDEINAIASQGLQEATEAKEMINETNQRLGEIDKQGGKLDLLLEEIVEVSENASSAIQETFQNVEIVRIEGVSPLEHNITPTLTGQNSSQATIRACGKNLLLPSYASTKGGAVTIGGVLFTEQEDGGIKINGTSKTNAVNCNLITKGDLIFPSGVYSFSLQGNIEGSSIKMVIGDPEDQDWGKYISGQQFTIKKDKRFNLGICTIQIPAGTTIDNIVVYPQIEYGENVTNFEKSKTVTYNQKETISSIAPTMTLYSILPIGSTGKMTFQCNKDTATYINNNIKKPIEDRFESLNKGFSNALIERISGKELQITNFSPMYPKPISAILHGINYFNFNKLEGLDIVDSSNNITLKWTDDNKIFVDTTQTEKVTAAVNTGLTLQQLCPQMKPNSTYYLNWESKVVSEVPGTENLAGDRGMIYIGGTTWKIAQPMVVTQKMLDSNVSLYGAHAKEGDSYFGTTMEYINIQISESLQENCYEYVSPESETVIKAVTESKDSFEETRIAENGEIDINLPIYSIKYSGDKDLFIDISYVKDIHDIPKEMNMLKFNPSFEKRIVSGNSIYLQSLSSIAQDIVVNTSKEGDIFVAGNNFLPSENIRDTEKTTEGWSYYLTSSGTLPTKTAAEPPKVTDFYGTIFYFPTFLPAGDYALRWKTTGTKNFTFNVFAIGENDEEILLNTKELNVTSTGFDFTVASPFNRICFEMKSYNGSASKPWAISFAQTQLTFKNSIQDGYVPYYGIKKIEPDFSGSRVLKIEEKSPDLVLYSSNSESQITCEYLADVKILNDTIIEYQTGNLNNTFYEKGSLDGATGKPISSGLYRRTNDYISVIGGQTINLEFKDSVDESFITNVSESFYFYDKNKRFLYKESFKINTSNAGIQTSYVLPKSVSFVKIVFNGTYFENSDILEQLPKVIMYHDYSKKGDVPLKDKKLNARKLFLDNKLCNMNVFNPIEDMLEYNSDEQKNTTPPTTAAVEAYVKDKIADISLGGEVGDTLEQIKRDLEELKSTGIPESKIEEQIGDYISKNGIITDGTLKISHFSKGNLPFAFPQLFDALAGTGEASSPNGRDDTKAIQQAIDAAEKVYIPKGIYWINTIDKKVHLYENSLTTFDCGLVIPSNREIILHPEAELKAIPNGMISSCLLFVSEAQNTIISGGILTGDYYGHNYQNYTYSAIKNLDELTGRRTEVDAIYPREGVAFDWDYNTNEEYIPHHVAVYIIPKKIKVTLEEKEKIKEGTFDDTILQEKARQLTRSAYFVAYINGQQQHRALVVDDKGTVLASWTEGVPDEGFDFNYFVVTTTKSYLKSVENKLHYYTYGKFLTFEHEDENGFYNAEIPYNSRWTRLGKEMLFAPGEDNKLNFNSDEGYFTHSYGTDILQGSSVNYFNANGEKISSGKVATSKKGKKNHESGHGISISCSKNITIKNMTIRNFVGDSIQIGGGLGQGIERGYETVEQVIIDNCSLLNARRNNISLIQCDNLQITNNIIQEAGIVPDKKENMELSEERVDVSGDDPEVAGVSGARIGIDIEPNFWIGTPDHQVVKKVLISHNRFTNNFVSDILLNSNRTIDCIVENNFFENDFLTENFEGVGIRTSTRTKIINNVFNYKIQNGHLDQRLFAIKLIPPTKYYYKENGEILLSDPDKNPDLDRNNIITNNTIINGQVFLQGQSLIFANNSLKNGLIRIRSLSDALIDNNNCLDTGFYTILQDSKSIVAGIKKDGSIDTSLYKEEVFYEPRNKNISITNNKINFKNQPLKESVFLFDIYEPREQRILELLNGETIDKTKEQICENFTIKDNIIHSKVKNINIIQCNKELKQESGNENHNVTPTASLLIASNIFSGAEKKNFDIYHFTDILMTSNTFKDGENNFDINENGSGIYYINNTFSHKTEFINDTSSKKSSNIFLSDL